MNRGVVERMRSFPFPPHRRRYLLACLSALLATTLSGKDALSQGRPGDGAPTSEPSAMQAPAGANPAARSRPDPVKDYLWEVYQRSTVKKDGTGEFTWKDIDAAKHVGLSMEDYTIGGIDPDFRELIYAIGKAMDAAGVEWSILSGYRDDYRQNLASGFKSHGGYSFHGGSTATGGYGHGCAMDISSPDRLSDDRVWGWFDQNSKNYGLRRPLPGTDPVHIQPLLGPAWHEKAAALRRARLAQSGDADPTVYPTTAVLAGVSVEQWGCVRPKGQETAHSEEKGHHNAHLGEDKAGPHRANAAPTEQLYHPMSGHIEIIKEVPLHPEPKRPPQRADAKPVPSYGETKPLPQRADGKPPLPRGDTKPLPQRVDAKAAPQRADIKPAPLHSEAKPPLQRTDTKPAKPPSAHSDAKPPSAQTDKATNRAGTTKSGTGT
jgi:hypothetical protein